MRLTGIDREARAIEFDFASREPALGTELLPPPAPPSVRVELVFEGGYQGVQRRARGTIYFLPSEFLPFSDERYAAELTGLRAEPSSDKGTTQAWSRSRARPWFSTRGERSRAQQVADELKRAEEIRVGVLYGLPCVVSKRMFPAMPSIIRLSESFFPPEVAGS